MNQVGHVVVVDDGSPNDVQYILDKLDSLGAEVVPLETNCGIATALNRGITAALERAPRPSFILTMDQDSLLEPGYTKKLLTAYHQAKADGVGVGMVAPGSISGLPTRRRGTVGQTLLGGEPIQSGLLIPADTLDSVGLLMDELFIDGVDTEFYLRVRDAGLESVVASDAHLAHALGSFVTASLFGKKLLSSSRPVHIRTAATYRYYYIFRNRLLLIRRYGRTQSAWAIAGLLADYRHLAVVSALASGRGGRIRSALAGIKDGLQGVSGRRVAK